MKSSAIVSVIELAAQWALAPGSGEIEEACRKLMDAPQPVRARSTPSFHAFIEETSAVLRAAASCPSLTHGLSDALRLLEQNGELERAHFAFLFGDQRGEFASADRDILQILAERLAAELQHDHRVYLLRRWCHDRRDRERLVSEYLALLSPDVRQLYPVWELANDMPAVLDQTVELLSRIQGENHPSLKSSV